jgi:hypothetical protein
MAGFSEKYGYIKPSSILIREQLTEEIQNAICSIYDMLRNKVYEDSYEDTFYRDMEEYLWCYFLNQRLDKFHSNGGYRIVATGYIEKKDEPWYKKIDLLEETVQYLSSKRNRYNQYYIFFISSVNCEFKRLNFAYRIINDQIVEVTSEEEISTIELASENASNSIRKHLQTSLELLSKRPDGDYRNSIKESISAVEALVREITGENTLNFKKLDSAGIILPSILRKAFELLYGYTNDSSTGIRHALMDDVNAPGADEAVFMLVSCSAFINYLTKKQ